MYLPPPGFHFRVEVLGLTLPSDDLRFTATGNTAKGQLAIDGEFSWPDGVMTGAMTLRGDRLLVADTPELRVYASPQLVLRAGVDGYRVEGEVLIPEARISPRELTTSVDTSPDERIVGLDDIEEGDPSTGDRVVTRVKVTLGDSVRINAYGLKARLGGAVPPCPFGLRRNALQREHLLARSRADGNAIGDRVADQVIQWAGFREVGKPRVLHVALDETAALQRSPDTLGNLLGHPAGESGTPRDTPRDRRVQRVRWRGVTALFRGCGKAAGRWRESAHHRRRRPLRHGSQRAPDRTGA